MGIVIIGSTYNYVRTFAFLACVSCLSPPLSSVAAPEENRVAGQQKVNAVPREGISDPKLDQEIETLRKEMNENPSGLSAVRLGDLLLKKGAADEALRSFEDALKINPRSLEGKIGRGVALGRLGDFGKAEQALRDALPLNPNPARVYYELGLLYERRGDFAKAVSEYKEGLKRYQEGMK